MESLKIYRSNNKEIPLIKGYPDDRKYQQYRMDNATESYYAKIDRSNMMIFIHFDLGVIGFWISYYIIDGRVSIHCFSTSDCLEQHNLLLGRSTYRSRGFGWRRIRAGQNNLIFLPEIFNEVKFSCDMMTFDVHFEKQILYALGKDFPELKPLIENVRDGVAGSLFEEFSYISPKSYHIIVLLMEMCRSKSMDKAKAKSLAIQLIKNHILDKNPVLTKYKFAFTDIEAIHRISLFLEEHMDQSEILSIARKQSYMAAGKLTEGFKLLFDCTLKFFLFEKRMIKTEELLLKDYTLEEICDQIGYSRPSHVENAFLRYYGITISQFRKMRS